MKKSSEKQIDIISGAAGLLIICCRMHRLKASKKNELIIRYLTKVIVDNAISLGYDTITWKKMDWVCPW